jgi:GGDEF domain-containing protein
MIDPIPNPVQSPEIMRMGADYDRLPVGLANIRINVADRGLEFSGMNSACAQLFQPPQSEQPAYNPADNSLLERMKVFSGGSFKEQDAALMVDQHLALVKAALEPRAEAGPREIVYEIGDRIIRERFLALRPAADGTVDVLVQLEDYEAELKVLREAVKGKADSLTGLYDREYLISQIDEALKSGKQFALLFADIDFFKDVNEEYGHVAGDDLLVELANKVNSCVRASGATDLGLRELFATAQRMKIINDNKAPLLVDAKTKPGDLRGETSGDTDVLLFPAEPGRIGGDEFLLFLPNLTPESIEAVRQRVESAVETIQIGDDPNSHLQISIDGIHSSEIQKLANGAPMTAEQMIDAADNAMYMRKLRRHLKNYEERVRNLLISEGFGNDALDRSEGIDNIIKGIRLTAETSFRMLDAYEGLNRKRMQSILNVALTSMLNDVLFVNFAYNNLFQDRGFGIHDLPAMRDDALDISMTIREVGPIIGGNSILNNRVTKELREFQAGKGERKWGDLSDEAKLAFMLFRQHIFYSIEPMTHPDNSLFEDLDKNVDPQDPLVIKFKELIANQET